MIFEEHRTRKNTRYEHSIWYLRRPSSITQDGLYTIGKLKRSWLWKQPAGPLHLTLNGDVMLSLEEAQEIVQFMEQQQ